MYIDCEFYMICCIKKEIGCEFRIIGISSSTEVMDVCVVIVFNVFMKVDDELLFYFFFVVVCLLLVDIDEEVIKFLVVVLVVISG